MFSVSSNVILVRKGGLEPPCPFERHPLKMVCLPVPPLPHILLCEAGWTRTIDHLLKRQMLYRLSYSLIVRKRLIY